jgi:hypothetical protein
MKTIHRTRVDHLTTSRSNARRTVDHPCSARRLCVRCSIIKVIKYRFKAFRQAFGRNPLPDEPLFFAEDSPSPQAAERDQMMRQLAQAADATMVQLPPLLKFMGLV